MRHLAPLALLAIIGCADSQGSLDAAVPDVPVPSGTYLLDSLDVAGSAIQSDSFATSLTIDREQGIATLSDGETPLTFDIIERDPEDWRVLCGDLTEVVDLDVELIDIAGYDLQDPAIRESCGVLEVRGVIPDRTGCGGSALWTIANFATR